MLKDTETEEAIVFFVTFLSLVAFQLGGGARPPALPLAMPMLVNEYENIIPHSNTKNLIYPKGHGKNKTSI